MTPGLQLRHEQPLKEKSLLHTGREMFTPGKKLLNVFPSRGENCLNEQFLNAKTETPKGKKRWLEK